MTFVLSIEDPSSEFKERRPARKRGLPTPLPQKAIKSGDIGSGKVQVWDTLINERVSCRDLRVARFHSDVNRLFRVN
jgi:hypothetical protein